MQPRNLDTGPGLLLPLVRILARAGAARVVFLPSDHHVPNPAPIASALSEAGEAVLPVTDSGRSDWGSPQRVFASLAGTDGHARLVARIGDAAAV